MDFIIDAIVEWLKGLLVDGIMGNLDGLFNNVNQSVGEIATQVGTTPADWNAGVFSMIRQLSETVVLPIAGIILTFVATYELIQMLIDRNNLHDVDTWMFFKCRTVASPMKIFTVWYGSCTKSLTSIPSTRLSRNTIMATIDLGPCWPEAGESSKGGASRGAVF